jgi:VanZ family protein
MKYSPSGTPNSSTRIRAAAALPAALWFLLIMVLLSLPGESFPTVEFWKPDKIAHILLFGGQAVLLWVALVLPYPGRTHRLRPYLHAGVATASFGILSEWYQAVFTTRAADAYDMVANIIGVILFLLLLRLVGPARLLSPLRRILRIYP